MLRALIFLAFGWFLIAAIAGLGHALSLTTMLPATSAIAIVHLASSPHTRGLRELSLPIDLALAMLLGYLADLHQGFPAGALCLAHGLAYLGIRWSAERLTIAGIFSRAFVTAFTALAIDLIGLGSLLLLVTPTGIGQESLTRSLWVLHWHALATLLAAPTVWWLFDRAYTLGDRLSSVANRGGPRPDRPGPIAGRNLQGGLKRSFQRPISRKPHDGTS